jgi:hypothetical protein
MLRWKWPTVFYTSSQITRKEKLTRIWARWLMQDGLWKLIVVGVLARVAMFVYKFRWKWPTVFCSSDGIPTRSKLASMRYREFVYHRLWKLELIGMPFAISACPLGYLGEDGRQSSTVSRQLLQWEAWQAWDTRKVCRIVYKCRIWLTRNSGQTRYLSIHRSVAVNITDILLHLFSKLLQRESWDYTVHKLWCADMDCACSLPHVGHIEIDNPWYQYPKIRISHVTMKQSYEKWHIVHRGTGWSFGELDRQCSTLLAEHTTSGRFNGYLYATFLQDVTNSW